MSLTIRIDRLTAVAPNPAKVKPEALTRWAGYMKLHFSIPIIPGNWETKNVFSFGNIPLSVYKEMWNGKVILVPKRPAKPGTFPAFIGGGAGERLLTFLANTYLPDMYLKAATQRNFNFSWVPAGGYFIMLNNDGTITITAGRE